MSIESIKAVRLFTFVSFGLLLASLSFAEPTFPLPSPAPVIRAVPSPSLHTDSLGGGDTNGGDSGSSTVNGECILSILSASESGGLSAVTTGCLTEISTYSTPMTITISGGSGTGIGPPRPITTSSNSTISSSSSTASLLTSTTSSASTSAPKSNTAISSKPYLTLVQQAYLITILFACLSFAYLL